MIPNHPVYVTVEVEKDLKEQAEAFFERLGLDMNAVDNMFLQKAVVEAVIPFSVSPDSLSAELKRVQPLADMMSRLRRSVCATSAH